VVLLPALGVWFWLLWGLRDRPGELAGLLAAVPFLALVALGVDRLAGPSMAVVGVGAMVMIGFIGLVTITGANPLTVASFALGLLKPAGWHGDHILLRALPFLMTMAHPLHPSRPMALVSALGVTAFLGIALMILHADV
jgi:hypothetical protein